MIWRIRKLFRSLLRLLQYLPVVWRNEDWDYIYLLKLIEYKLSRMEKAHRNDPFHPDHMKRVGEIHTCRLLLQRLMKDDYAAKEWDLYHEKYPLKWLIDTDGTSYIPDGSWDKARGRELKQLMELESIQRQQDQDLFFKELKRHYRNWWV